MKTEELKGYLSIVVDMEENIFLQNTLIGDLKKRIKELQVPQIYADPIAPTRPQPPKIKYGDILLTSIGGPIYLWWVPLLISLVLWVIIAVLFQPNPNAVIPWLLILSYAGLFMYCVIFSIDAEMTKPRKAFDEAMLTYKREMESYRRATQQNQVKRQQDKEDRETKTLLLQSELSQVSAFLEKSQERLHIVYNKNIIFPKYRNLVAACSLYEYICAGRCSSLEGHEGAYNIYETEMRLDRIITQLDRVIANLGAIRENQFILYSAIQTMNQQSMRILESTQEMAGHLRSINGQAGSMAVQIADLQKTSELTAYHAERTQKELAYMNRMDYLSGRNDDVFINHPPV